MQVIFSSESRREDADRQRVSTKLGTEHYSYNFVYKKFKAAFESFGLSTHFVNNPAAIKHPIAFRKTLGAPADECLHLSVRSTANMRRLPGAKNVGLFAWEFDVLRTDIGPSDSVTSDQRHMLRIMDEIWTPCRYTANVLKAHGVETVRRVPAPVYVERPQRLAASECVDLLGPLPVTPLAVSSGLHRGDNAALTERLTTSMGALPAAHLKKRGRGKIFLSVCNPGDLRKNLIAMIEGFQAAAPDEGSVFLIKLVVPNVGEYRRTTQYDQILPRFNGPGAMRDDRVLFILDYLSDDELSALYSIADYYVCASHCEGQNLPLQEAMAHGCVPISTANTAMADYIDGEDGVVIAERTWPAPLLGTAGDVARKRFDLHVASRFDVASAIGEGMGMTRDRWEELSRASQERIHRLYSAEAVMELIRELEPALFASPGDQQPVADLAL